jgi:2-polyprenyl-3-methyl-5-hydroxy-6-metoxy-1,4-benzoquinol methylase
MDGKKCALCGVENSKKREGKVRDNAYIEIFECLSCGLVFLSSVDHLPNGFYETSQMSHSDLSVRINDCSFDDERRYKTHAEMIKNKTILDFGCGTGGFLKRAKGIAGKVYGVELEEAMYKLYTENDITVFRNIEETKETFDYIFMFHVLEHLKEPLTIISKLIDKLSNFGRLIVEVPNADDALLTLYENKAFSEFTYWSPHLYLYNPTTLNMLAKKAGIITEAIKQEQRYPLSNHLYWMSNGKPGGHGKWTFFNNEELKVAYEKTLAAIGKCDTIIGYFKKG